MRTTERATKTNGTRTERVRNAYGTRTERDAAPKGKAAAKYGASLWRVPLVLTCNNWQTEHLAPLDCVVHSVTAPVWVA